MADVLNVYPKYSKIYDLSHREVEGFLGEQCIVEEKIDGSQFSFGVFGQDLIICSKNQRIIKGNEPKMFLPAVKTALRLFSVVGLKPGWIYRSETLQRPKHNTLNYSRVPEGNIIIYDIDIGNGNLLQYADKAHEAERLGLEVVPMLYSGMVTQDLLKEIVEGESCLGGEKMEGVVIKRTWYNTIFGKDKKVLMAKYVREAFKERHQKDWKDRNPKPSSAPKKIAEQFSTPARWAKSVQRLKEMGNYDDENELRNIPAIIRINWHDILKEEGDEMMEILWRHHAKQIRKSCGAGIAEWFKKSLLEEEEV